MLVNCFLLFNEIDHLRLRLEYEYSFYDKFLIVEGTKTFAGKKKILYFEKYKHLFTDFLDKIQYEVIDDFPEVINLSYSGSDGQVTSEFRWHLEGYSRECVQKALTKMGLSDHDLVVYSDIDEIVNLDTLREAIKRINDSEVHRFDLFHYEYSVAFKPISEHWIGPYLTKFKYLKTVDTIGLLRAISVPASNTRVFKYYIKSFLEKMLCFVRSSFHSHQRTKEASVSVSQERVYQNEGEVFEVLFNGGASFLPTDIALRKAGIKRATFHTKSGWHFSYMTGGFKEYFLLKVQNFSHSELSTGEQLDTKNDYYEIQQAYISKMRSDNLYSFENLDSRLPHFLEKNIAEYCFLLLPKDIDPSQFK